MKKLFSFAIILFFSFNLSSQQQYNFQIDTKAKKPAWMESGVYSYSVNQAKPEIPYPGREVEIVNIIDIGTSINAYQLAAKRSSLWVDPDLNTVSFYHSLMPGYYNFGYDISTDGGTNWDLMVGNFTSGGVGARYPNHGIYNPAGNTNPDEAFIVFNARGFDADNDNDGLLIGLSSIGDASNYSSEFDTSGQLFYKLGGFDITSGGNIFSVSPMNSMLNDTFEYLDSLIITKGVWNETSQNFYFISTKIEAVINEDLGAPTDVKIAFSPDGETAYITMLGNNGMAQQIEGFSNIYPIYWTSTDGGDSWEGPEFIQMDGPTGLIAIVYHHLNDELIYELFGNNPPARTEISYTTAFDHDITVDNGGNLHLAVVIGPTASDPYSIISAKGYLAVLDFVMNGDTWCPVEMGRLSTFRGYFGDLTEDNRVQISRTVSGDRVFVSWLDTDIEDAEDNNRPNIWCRGWKPSTYWFTSNAMGEDAPTNVTLFSAGMWQSYFFSAPKIVFETDAYKIPFVYADFDPTDPATEVQHEYIQDFSFDMWDFNVGSNVYCGIVGIQNEFEKQFLVSANKPNPFSNKTTFELELAFEIDVSLEVYSADGKQVFSEKYPRMQQGKNQIEFNAGDLKSGIYFYTFYVDGKSKSGKMIIK